MNAIAQVDPRPPTFEASCVRFEIRDGSRRVSCAVSDEALDAVSGLTEASTPGLRRRSFDRFRTLIHAAALLRLETRLPGCIDPIVVTIRDLQRVPPQTGTPKFGTSASSARTA